MKTLSLTKRKLEIDKGFIVVIIFLIALIPGLIVAAGFFVEFLGDMWGGLATIGYLAFLLAAFVVFTYVEERLSGRKKRNHNSTAV